MTMTVPKMRDIFEIAPLPLVWLPFVGFWLVFNVFLIEGVKYLLNNKKHLFTKKYYYRSVKRDS